MTIRLNVLLVKIQMEYLLHTTFFFPDTGKVKIFVELRREYIALLMHSLTLLYDFGKTKVLQRFFIAKITNENTGFYTCPILSTYST